MKHIKKSDLSLNKETITNLSDNVDSPQTQQVTNCYDCVTIYTCGTQCQQLTCPGHSEDTNCNATSETDCLCMSVNVQCETHACNPSKSIGPVCCEPPEESQQGGVCPLSEPCEVSGLCEPIEPTNPYTFDNCTE